MSGHVAFISEKNHPLAVGRNVWEPVVIVVGENLLLITAVGLHAPDLHVSGALGVEVNVLAVGRILGTIVETHRGGEACFFSARDWNCVDVEFTVALTDKGEGLAIRRPTMPIRRRIFGYAARLASGDRDDVNE